MIDFAPPHFSTLPCHTTTPHPYRGGGGAPDLLHAPHLAAPHLFKVGQAPCRRDRIMTQFDPKLIGAIALRSRKCHDGNAATLKANQNIFDRVQEILDRGARGPFEDLGDFL